MLRSEPSPSCVIAQKTGIEAFSSNSTMKVLFTLCGSGSPTNPKSTGSGERRIEGIQLASAPVNPIALQPMLWSDATIFLLINPAYTIVTSFRVSESVILLPCTFFVSIPNCSAIFVAIAPPP